MQRQVLFIQGAGQGTYAEWDNRLVDSLMEKLGRDYEIRYPRMPNEADPTYLTWKRALEKEFADLNDGTILIGHSVGATVLINAIAADQPQFKAGGIFLVSGPFIGKGGWPSGDIEPKDELGAELPEGVPIYLYHGSDDEIVPIAHVELYAEAIPQAIIRRLEGRDHQLNDDLKEVAEDILSLG
jgi:predicted alpha/beta hydrolase family esterase